MNIFTFLQTATFIDAVAFYCLKLLYFGAIFRSYKVQTWKNIVVLHSIIRFVSIASIVLAEKTTLKYEIYDNAGKRMNVPKWEDYSLGEHEIAIDLDAPAGMYFVKFSTDKGYFKSMKLIKK